ncbi:MAG: sensor histidine kinase [Myxococcales bacterium]
MTGPGAAALDPEAVRDSSVARADSTGIGFTQERFLTRARALFYARIAFLTLGLLVLGVPGWSSALGIGGTGAVAVYLAMLGYSAANHALLRNPRLGRPVTFATLCADLGVLVWIAALTGGLRSPFFAAQLLFTTLFVVLFPTPLALLPPLLTFPAVFKLERLLGGDGGGQLDGFVLVWYAAINCILVYLMVYLNDRDRARHRDLRTLHRAVREVAVAEERNRLSREIHDGLGGVLSAVVIQSEYLLNMIDGSEIRAKLGGNTEVRAAIVPTLRKEISDLHGAAEQSVDELRRSLRMMQDSFDLPGSLRDYCQLAATRHRLQVRFSMAGAEEPIGPESSFALFRVLQESLTNVSKHCGRGTAVDVALTFQPGEARLSTQDHGPGFDMPRDPGELQRQGHYGLANMRERAAKVHGRVQMTSAPGRGTRIELTVRTTEERASPATGEGRRP